MLPAAECLPIPVHDSLLDCGTIPMHSRHPSKTAPTEPLLGPWSMTALAALLVVGGTLALLPTPSVAGELGDGADSLHPDRSRRAEASAVTSALDHGAAPGATGESVSPVPPKASPAPHDRSPAAAPRAPAQDKLSPGH